jgi:hypothetical protein
MQVGFGPFGMQPPGIGGTGPERIEVVLTAPGLADFESECADAKQLLSPRLQLLPANSLRH